ncbi:hypothetical protein ACFQ6N_00175 [Kitasatospora sp. NPDC056446]|uniref:hypothetical protein n=1 Tax=Kitasatospora sp. NPDC056446 TaxID=3345819 RepID=UPI0036B85F3C
MTVEDSGRPQPQPQPQPGDPVLAAGLEVAMKWGAALGGPEKLQVALTALEPQLKREHQLNMRRLELRHLAEERAAADARAAEERAARAELHRRQYALRMAGLYAGGAVSAAMLVAGVYVARDVWWLAVLLCGPSLLAVTKVFVLRRSDPGDMAGVSLGVRRASADGELPPPPSAVCPPEPDAPAG